MPARPAPWRARLLLVAALGLVAPRVAGADPPPPDDHPGAVRAQYLDLVKHGCDLHRHPVRLPLEARVLRNVPFAIAGRRFKSAGLTWLFSHDGGWYQPRSDKVVLGHADRLCVARLAKLEHRLRRALPMTKKVEAVLVRSRLIFLQMHQLSTWRSVHPGRAHSATGPQSWIYTVEDVPPGGCGDPGAPDGGDCASFTFRCWLPEGHKDLAHLECEMMSVG
jgi:hypothetical protein